MLLLLKYRNKFVSFLNPKKLKTTAEQEKLQNILAAKKNWWDDLDALGKIPKYKNYSDRNKAKNFKSVKRCRSSKS